MLVAEHQTAGRGRLDRSWETPPRAALTFSVLLRPDLEPARWPWLPLLTGVAVANGVRRTTGLETVGLKWPNDLLLGGEKAAGILLERVETSTGPAAVVGVGLNVAQTRDELPVPTATSLALAGADADRGTLLVAVLEELATLLDDLPSVPNAYADLCDTLGQVVNVSLPTGETLTGRAVSIDDDGRLDLETDAGRVAVGAGDVVHVR